MTHSKLYSKIVMALVCLSLFVGCGQPPESPSSRLESAQSNKAAAQAAASNRAKRRGEATASVSPATPTPEPEKRVTLTTTTTLRELAAELTKQLGIEYAADDEVANTTIALDLENATRDETEAVIREKTKVRLIYSDRDVPEQWVHFAPEL